jgi:hypothetical protein
MDRITFVEALLADYIMKVQILSRDKLLQEVIELKSLVLEFTSDEDLISNTYVQRRTRQRT